MNNNFKDENIDEVINETTDEIAEQADKLADVSNSEAVEEIEDEAEDKINWKDELISWVKIFVTAMLIAAVLDNFIIINANVPSGSMHNTIMTHDRMIGNRLAYINSNPERGDVIIFKFPDDETQNYVKRVIGLPGDKVVIKNAKIYINDSEEPLVEDYLPEEWNSMNDGLEYEVPMDSYFVLGDNRNISNDARYWNNKFVRKDAIIAKAMFVYWPFKNIKTID